MHIKKIVIQGFKSYGERTVIGPFDPGHNVIVGYNGSGKSNFFAAIQFVLSDEYSRLQNVQRHALLHDGNGPRAMAAAVEIIFDNSDKRITIDKNEISLKRVIGAKKDQYILNKNIISRNEVVNLLETAGFSKSNPYYIIRQGKVNEVAMTSETRLMLLKEIAGVQVYEDRRNESLSILNDTRLKIKNIEELLQTINEKLETLKDETKEFKEYQQWDKKMRTVEHIIYHRELSNNKNKIEELTTIHADLKKEQAHLQYDVEQFLNQIKVTSNELKRAQNDAEIAEEEKDNLSKELDKLLVDKESYSIKIAELIQDIESSKEDQELIKRELEDSSKEIEEVQIKLATIKPQYDNEVKKGEEIIRKLDSVEQERQVLYARQSRGAQFRTKEERNAWISDELILIDKQIEEKQKHIKNLQKHITENEMMFDELEKLKHKCLDQMGHESSSINEFRKQFINLNKKRDELSVVRKDLCKKEKSLLNDIGYLEEDLRKINQHLISRFGKGIFNGINSVNKVLKTFHGRDDMVDQLHHYYGLVIERFTCDSKLYRAIEVTAGNRLFHHIVGTAEFGQKILKEMNKQDLPGVVTFMPIDRLAVENVLYPEFKGHAMPLISTLSFNETFQIPIRHIFGKIIICRDLKIGSEVASSRKFDCVTLGGDQASSKGWLKGGHFTDSKSPMKMQQDKMDLIQRIDLIREETLLTSNQIKRTDSLITSSLSDLQLAETKCSKARETYGKLIDDLNDIKGQLDIIENNQVIQRKNLQDLESDLINLKMLKKNLNDELQHDLIVHLTSTEKRQIEHLTDSMAQLRKELKNILKTRDDLEKEKNVFENRLSGNLNGRKAELERKLGEINLEDKQFTLQELEYQYNVIIDKIEKCESDLQLIKSNYKNANEQKRRKIEEMEKLYTDLTLVQQKFDENSKKLENLSNKIRILDETIENTKRNIFELGLVSSNSSYSGYTELNSKKLYKELDICRKHLKDYQHVNKRALDQYETFKDQRDNLFKRKEELDRAREKVEQLFDFLQKKKYEAVLFTFKQVSKYFTEIFSSIVPRGKAQLVMEQGNSQNENDSLSPSSINLDSIVGIGIRVSFTGQTCTMVDYNQLSGGQKSLVALTLIFAIQKCDPAPFYLFDEIDRDLDTDHRRAVAQMIRELSSEAQFITVTFRPELLEKANQYYGVKFQNNVSTVFQMNREEALKFVEDDTE